MSEKQKLELTWIGKENRLGLEPRILLEDPEKSYHATHRVREKKGSRGGAENAEMENNPAPLRASASPRENESGDFFNNRLIHGDNLLAR